MTSEPYPRRWVIAVIAALAVLIGACADEGDEATTTSDSTEETTSTTSDSVTTASTDSTTTSTTSTESTNTTASTDSTATTATTAGLPGEEISGYVTDGDVLGVVAVRHDDVLNIRALPGTNQRVVTTADPTDVDLVATGRARLLPRSIWWEVEHRGRTGWASSRFLGNVAGTDDVTAAFLADYGERPVAETLVELGELVAAEFASVDPPSRIVLTVGPSVGDLGEVTYDVIGLGDDSVLGFRLHLFAVQLDDGESFELRTIEQTLFCARGTSGEICV